MAETTGGREPLLRLQAVGRDFDVSRPWLNRVFEGAVLLREGYSLLKFSNSGDEPASKWRLWFMGSKQRIMVISTSYI